MIKIEEGGNGKFGYQYFVIGGQPFLFNQSYDFTGRTYETPDKVATIYYDVTLDPFENSNELALYFKLHSINIKDEKYFSLIGNIGSESEYIDLEGGFTGDGGLNLVAETDENGIVDTEIYLGGDANTYTGATIVNSGVTLHLESADTISDSTELKLYGNASFVVDDSTGTGNEFTNFNKVTLVGTSSTGADGATQTQISGGGSAIKLDGTGKQFSFFQEDSLHPDEPQPMAANFALANSPVPYSSLLTHHTVNVKSGSVDILNGASLLVNYLGKTIGGNLDPSAQDNVTDLAILALGEKANVLIDGYGAGDNTSAHLYMGNGIIRLDNGSSLTLAGGAAIHFSAHRDGMFEYPYNDDGSEIADLADNHKYASIELNGGTLNLELDAQSHLYSDHILSADHKHFLIGAAYVDSDGNPITSPVSVADNVTFCLTSDAINRIAGLIDDTITQDWEEQYHLPLEQVQQLQTIYDEQNGKYKVLMDMVKDTANPSAVAALQQAYQDAVPGATAEDFNNLLSTLVTLGMNNDVHGFMFQKYGVQFTDKGAYMYVLETLSVEDFINQTGIQVSIKNEVNEVLDILQGGKQQDYVNSGAFVIINNVLDTVTGEQTYDATVAAARTVDSAAQLSTVVGTQTLAWDMLQTRSDSTQRHLDSIKTCRPTNCTFGPIFCICTTAVTVCGLT